MAQQPKQASPQRGPHFLKSAKLTIQPVRLRTDAPTDVLHAACALGFGVEHLYCLMGRAWALPGEDFQTDVQIAFDMVGDALRILEPAAQDKAPAQEAKTILKKMEADWDAVYGGPKHMKDVKEAYDSRSGHTDTNSIVRAMFKQMPLAHKYRQLHSKTMSTAHAVGRDTRQLGRLVRH